MAVRTLTDQEYLNLAGKALETSGILPSQLNEIKQVHRLLCEGRDPESLTLAEQKYTGVFKGATLAQIPNDYGWEPGIDEVEAEPEAKPQKSKKNDK